MKINRPVIGFSIFSWFFIGFSLLFTGFSLFFIAAGRSSSQLLLLASPGSFRLAAEAQLLQAPSGSQPGLDLSTL